MRSLLLAVLALAVAAPAAHAASGFDEVFRDYAKDGRIDACKHSAAELQRARDDVPPDIEQYAPDFPDALDRAIEARARGRCDKKSKPAPGPAPPARPPGPVPATRSPSRPRVRPPPRRPACPLPPPPPRRARSGPRDPRPLP